MQASVLNRTFGCIRVVWNRTLAWRCQRYREDKTGTTFALYLAKMGTPLAFNWSWPEVDPATIDPSTVTVSRDPCGRWYVSLAVHVPDPDPLPATSRAVGVDLGIKDFAVTSDQQRIPNPRHLERRARNLARYQRRMARCQQGSANRVKAKAKAARAHRKVRAARTDFLHKTSIRLVRDHDLIVHEDLAVQNMARNRAVARAIGDCGWGIFRAMLEYKAAWYGRHVIVIDRWFPSSKLCSACGYVLADLGLKVRMWQCPSCGARHDRDVNAAKNILAAGLAVAGGDPGHACGADVRHPGPLGCGRPRNRNSRA